MKFKLNILIAGIILGSSLSINLYAEDISYRIPKDKEKREIYNGILNSGLSGQELLLARKLIETGNRDIEQKFSNAKKDVIYAQLAGAAYLDGDVNKPKDWQLVQKKIDNKTGFKAVVFRNLNSEVVLAFAGTDGIKTGINKDLDDDFQLFKGKVNSQQRQAIEYAKVVFSEYSPNTNITITGHSLGGNLAQTVAIAFNKNAVTFNSAQVGIETKGLELDGKSFGYKSSKITADIRNYIMAGDFVSSGTSMKGQNYGENIYINVDESSNVHGIKIVIKHLNSMGKFYDFYVKKYQHPSHNNHNINMLNNLSTSTQYRTSHFGTPNNHRFNTQSSNNQEIRNRETIQENPYLAQGSAIIEAPADIVLNWGNRPSDLDSHLTGPINAQSNERFHVYFGNKGNLNHEPHVYLYTDNVSHGVGRANNPEQMRINVTQPGIYNYYVHDFSNGINPNSQALSQSGAVVSVHSAGNRELPEGNNLGHKVAEFSVPQNQAGTVWHTFELDTRRNTIRAIDKVHSDTNQIK